MRTHQPRSNFGRKEVTAVETQKISKSELRRSVLEAIRAARCITSLKRDDLLRAGTYGVTCQRLNRLEKQLYRSKRKSHSKDVISKIANEVAHLIGNLTKSLIRYLQPPFKQGVHPVCDRV